MFKKITALLLFAALLAGPATALANDRQVDNAGFIFEIRHGQMTIVDYTGPGGSITIPRAAPDGRYVLAIGQRVFEAANLNNVSFQSDSRIRSIGLEAFRRSNISQITLPNSLNEIGEGAFEDNSRLTQITLPSNLEAIGAFAFSRTRLTRISIPASVRHIDDEAFSTNSSLREAHFEHMDGRDIDMGSHVFRQTAGDFRITRPARASHFPSNWYPPHNTAAADGTAVNYDDWQWTSLPGNNVMITGFHWNSQLYDMQRIEIPARLDGRTVRAIQGRAFENLPNLREVVIPDTVTDIDSRAFNNNRELRSAFFNHSDGGTVSVHRDAFVGSHSTFTILFPYGARGFTTPTWNGFPTQPGNVEGLWEFTLLGISNELMITGYNGNAGIVEIPSVIEGRPVRYIGNHVFVDNTVMTELIVPDSVVSIAANAVQNAPNLRVARLRHRHADTLDLSVWAFSGVHRDFTLVFPADATGFTPVWSGFPAEPDLISANWDYTISGGAVTINDYRGDEDHVEIPPYISGIPVRVIASLAFWNNADIERVTIPASVNTIESNAFFNVSNLYAAHLLHTNANQLNNFSDDSFVGVAPHFRLVVPNDAAGFTTPFWNGYLVERESDTATAREGDFEFTIRREAVQGASGATRDVVTITRYLGNDEEVEIPDTLGGFPVTAIGDFAFQQNLTLRRVIIPASVHTVGQSSFLGASNLETAFFLHPNGQNIRLHANTFRYTANNFTIMYPPNAAGFSTPTWQGWPARPGTPGTPAHPGVMPPNQGPGADLNNPLIRTTRVLNSQDPYMTRDNELLHAPIFRLETFPAGSPYATSYVMVRVIADILGLDWDFNPGPGTATFTGYNVQNQFITMEITIGSTAMRVNGMPREVRAAAGVVPAVSREGRLFVPVAVFQEVFGVAVQWNAANATVTVNP